MLALASFGSSSLHVVSVFFPVPSSLLSKPQRLIPFLQK